MSQLGSREAASRMSELLEWITRYDLPDFHTLGRANFHRKTAIL